MSCPPWIDETLSRELPVLRDRGEDQHREFMRCYPKNGYELSKEIAAFASSNPGIILIGVADDGSLVGIEGVDTPEGRDRLCKRIEGVCSGNVRPAITPVVKFAKEEDAVVLAITIPRGAQPIYYNKNTPYVRHLTQARPADPHEVIERVAEWLKLTPLAQSDSSSQFLSELAATLIEILIYGSELEQRNDNPWLDLVRTQLGAAGKELRHFAADDKAVEFRLDTQLRSIADKLDAAAAHHLLLGGNSWKTLAGYVADAVEQAARLKAALIDVVPFSAQSRKYIADLHRPARELADLDGRAKAIAENGRINELQEAASRIGHSLLVATHYLFADPESPFIAKIREIGRELHLLETERLYLDGGQSMHRIVGMVHDLNSRLQALLSESDSYHP